jgi:hypothetical protein
MRDNVATKQWRKEKVVDYPQSGEKKDIDPSIKRFHYREKFY